MSVRTGLLPDRYTGAQPVGRGGMGEIYRATDTSLGRAVAVKLLAERYSADESVRERFTREALAAARLSGISNIVTIYDVGEWAGRPYIVMEYLSGGSLEECVRNEGQQPPARALAWLEEAAGALDAAHRAGVVHRDVKPANFLLDGHDRVHVADFGIASAAGLGSLTETGTVLGTASYLSPEQAKGQRTTSASDRYSLGVVAFELLTGRRPFEGDSVAAEAAAHVTGEIPSVCDVSPDAPWQLDPVFQKALAKDPADRYGSCAEFVGALRRALDEAAGATGVIRPVVEPGRVRVAGGRPGWLLPLLGLLALAAIGAGVVATMGGHNRRAGAASVSIRIVTQKGTTVQQTVTAPAPTTAATPTTAGTTTATAATTAAATTTTAAVVSGDPVALNDQAWAMMRQSNYNGALPLLERAVQGLQGRGDLAEAYANYNLGYVLMRLGRCSDAILPLERSLSLQPDRKEVKDALKEARRC